jgi:hypothetical protein
VASSFCGLLWLKMEVNRSGAVPKSLGGGKKKDVFQGFEYIPSRYSLADELKAKASRDFV